MTSKRFFALIPFALILSGCISVLPETPPAARIYALRVGDIAALESPVPLTLAVAPPQASRAIAGGDIVWRRGAEIAFMDRAAWDGAAVDLLQNLLVDTVERRNLFRSAVRVGDGAIADLEVRWDVQSFEIRESGGSQSAHFEASARLIDTRRRIVLDDTRVTASAPLRERSGAIAAAALQDSARNGALAIGGWAAERAQALAVSNNR
jgi:cholesterol transport system auxiliary component